MLPELFKKQDVTMNTLEISELTGSRHDNVVKSVERLADRKIIRLPPLQEIRVKRSVREVPVQVYTFSGEQGKRDSLVVVAQLSPEFTGALVDRWMELEQHLEIGGRAQADLLKYATDIGLMEQEDAKFLIEKMIGGDPLPVPKVQEYATIPTLAKMLDLNVVDLRDLLHMVGVYDDEQHIFVRGRRRNALSSLGRTLAVKENDRAHIKWKIPQTIDFLTKLK